MNQPGHGTTFRVYLPAEDLITPESVAAKGP